MLDDKRECDTDLKFDHPSADHYEKSVNVPSPLKAARQYCVKCSSNDVREPKHCPSVNCPLYLYRFGRNPTAEEIASVADAVVFPLEDPATQWELQAKGTTALKSIRRHCIDCSDGSKLDVKMCSFTDCQLYPFRFGKNPNRKLSPERREETAKQLKQYREKKAIEV